MKTNFLLLPLLLLAGCQTPPPDAKPLPDLPPMPGRTENYAGRAPRDPAPAPRETTCGAPTETNSASPAQVVEALIAQNDALTARLRALENNATGTPTPSATPARTNAEPLAPMESSPRVAAPTPSEIPPLLVPNADGVIDTTARHASGTPGNPFAVRTLATEAGREIILSFQGIIQGARPCALVNGRVVEAGETIESLRLTRLEPAALILSGDGFAINLPLGTTKVRLAL